MSKSPVDAVALAAATLAVLVGLTLLTGPLSWLASIAGLVLLLTLFAYDTEAWRTGLESVAFAAVFALCVALAAAAPLTMLAASEGRGASVDSEWLPLLWIGTTVIFFPIDRARMSGRVQPVRGESLLPNIGSAPPYPQRATIAPAASYAPPPAPQPVYTPPPPPAYTPPPQPPPVTYAPPPPPPTPEPAYVPPPPVQPPFAPPPPAPAAYVPPPPPAYQAPEPVYRAPEPAYHTPEASFAPPLVTPPAPAYAPIPPGRAATIYVNLVGEGINLMRPVQAENLGRDYYRIADDMPAGERWEFGPGQVVKCKKKNLSSGKAMVAVEEAPRAQR